MEVQEHRGDKLYPGLSDLRGEPPGYPDCSRPEAIQIEVLRLRLTLPGQGIDVQHAFVERGAKHLEWTAGTDPLIKDRFTLWPPERVEISYLRCQSIILWRFCIESAQLYRPAGTPPVSGIGRGLFQTANGPVATLSERPTLTISGRLYEECGSGPVG